MVEPLTGTVTDVLATAVDEAVVPGLVAVVAGPEGLRYEQALGVRDTAEGDPVALDTVFRIASQTKLLTAISILQLVEQGRIGLDTPVGDVLPAFDELPVLEGFDGDEPRIRPARGRATLRQLLTHTSGLAYDIWNDDVDRYHDVGSIPRLQTGSRASFAMPLVSDPGTRFSYGTSMDWVGLLVEHLDGRPLERYWQEELCDPLGLPDTTPAPSEAQRARMAPVHVQDADGAWVPTAIDFARDPELYAGGHCLYSTAHDYLRLQRMVLRGGELDGRRYLQPETVEAMFRNQIGELGLGTIVAAHLDESRDVPLGERKWGLGIMVEPDGVHGGRAPGSGSWMGGFNSFYWIDPASRLTAALYTATVPFYDAPIVELALAFERAVYAATPTIPGS